MNKKLSELDIPRDDPQIITDSKDKRGKVRKLLKDQNLSGIILSRRENFAWVSTGGDATIINSTHDAIGCILITQKDQFFICHSMDGRRILEEELPGQDYELIELKWYENSPIKKAVQIAGDRPGADTNIPTVKNMFGMLLDLHYPMTDLEFARLGWIGQTMNDIFLKMGKYLVPGMTESEIASHFECIQAERGIKADVLIAGGDDRLFKYRHPMPSNNKVNKHLMLHSAPKKWGLHAPITRFYSFGEPSLKLSNAFEVVVQIQAGIFSMIKPGLPYSEIFRFVKNAYRETGFPNEWENHFQGGPTGYMIVDGQRLLSDKLVQAFTPFEWFSTVPGAKIAELTLLGNEHAEIASLLEPWPQKSIDTGQQSVKMPWIYIIE